MLLRKRLFILLILIPSFAYTSRIKDITNLAGVRDNQLVGYGLVVGLDGTGDKVTQAPFTQQSFINMLNQFGIRLPIGTNLQLKNVAAVAVSATLPPFARIGQRVDITVASLANATSLRGGELLLTPLRGADGQVYAVGQGSIIVSGFGANGNDGSKVIVNQTSSGRIPGGATVEKTIDSPFVKDGAITFELMKPDFTTAETIEAAINKEFNQKVAFALDAGIVRVKFKNLMSDYSQMSVKDKKARFRALKYDDISDEDELEDKDYYQKQLMRKYVPIISRIENISLVPAQTKAKVVVNSRTGTIVVDQNVTISPVAVSHGNLSVIVSEKPYVSQPEPLSNGQTVVGTSSTISIHASPSRAFVFSPGPTLNDLVNAINSVGAAPGDIIAILEAINAAGALHAELEII